MKGKTRLVILIALLASVLWGGMVSVRAADPVTLNLVKAYVVVLNDGRLDVKYSLTFTEHESRDKISNLGPFDTPHTIVSSQGSGPAGPFVVTLAPGDKANYYRLNFERPTRAGEQYTVEVRYTVDRSVFDTTTVKDREYKAIGWAPFQWDLPIEKLELDYVLPIEIPSDITQPEQVTDEVVDATGLLVEDTSQYDRWI